MLYIAQCNDNATCVNYIDNVIIAIIFYFNKRRDHVWNNDKKYQDESINKSNTVRVSISRIKPNMTIFRYV